jgi:hypothetical protein
MLCAAGCTDPLLQSRLVDAARGGRLREVQDGLRRGAQVDVLDQGSLAIVEAATYGHTEVVDELLAHGADPNKEDGYGQVAIQWAALNGNVDMTRNLLDHGAAIEKGDPLACASMQGQVPVIDLLLDRKADVGRHTPGEETAIELAASHGHAEAVAVLCAAERRATGRNTRCWGLHSRGRSKRCGCSSTTESR